MTKIEEFENYKEKLLKYRENTTLDLRKLETENRSIIDINSKRKKELDKLINDKVELILELNELISLIRIPSDEEIKNRKIIFENFAKEVSQLLTVDSYLSFYGCNNIKKVIDIINSNNINLNTTIDITKSVEDAEPGFNTFFPYGAIFVFDNSEQYFKNKVIKNKISYIITTEENKDKLKYYCNNYRYNENIVITHEEFIDICKKKYEKKDRIVNI